MSTTSNQAGLIVRRNRSGYSAAIVIDRAYTARTVGASLHGATRDDALIRALFLLVSLLRRDSGTWVISIPSQAVVSQVERPDALVRPEVSLTARMIAEGKFRIRHGVLVAARGSW